MSSAVDLDTVMQPWGRTVRQVFAASECTTYENSPASTSMSSTERSSPAVRSSGGNGLATGDEVFTVGDEHIFKTKSEFGAHKVAALRKIIAHPEASQMEAAGQLKIEKDMISASLAFGKDPLLISRAVKIIRDVLLKGSRGIDLGVAEKMNNSSAVEAVVEVESELEIIAATGDFPGESAADLINVKDVNA